MMMASRLWSISDRRIWFTGFGSILTALLCLITVMADLSGWTEPANQLNIDLWHQLAGVRRTPIHTAIISIDNDTLLLKKDVPMIAWGPDYAQAINTLKAVGVQSIGIDFLFSVSIESWLRHLRIDDRSLSRTYDVPLRATLNDGGVILVANLAVDESGASHLLMPVNDYLYSLPNGRADVGLANLYLDGDGVVRRFVPSFFDDGRSPGESFGALLAQQAKKAESIDLPLVDSTQPFPIGFVGPPGTVPRLSFGRLLQPNASADPTVQNLAGRVVIISAEHSGTGNDVHLVPYSRRFLSAGGSVMTGAEIHANIVETILSGRFPHPAPMILRIGFLAIAMAASVIICLTLSPLWSLVGLAGLAGLSWGIGYLAFLGNWVLPLAAAAGGMVLCYVGAIGRRLTREAQQRAWLRQVIGPYVSDEVIEGLIQKGQMPDLGGQTVPLTILFSDIRSFTAISEQLSPAEVVELLNRYFSLVCEPILSLGGMVDKYIGDAVMAIFGAPAPHPDAARRALRAAVEMQAIADSVGKWMDERFPDRNLPPFRVGVGIHTGEAVVGNIGSVKRMAFTAIGDTVNIAARLETMSKKLCWPVVASDETVRAAGPDIVTGRRKTVTPKGREGTIEVVEILDVPNEDQKGEPS